MKWKKLKKLLCQSFFCKNNLTRDIVVIMISIGLAALLVVNHRDLSKKQEKKLLLSAPVVIEDAPEQEVENEAETPTIDTVDWKTYKTQWYGFELKYPKEWNAPSPKGAAAKDKWEYLYQFRKKEPDENNPYVGFDVVVYNVKNVKELSDTDEFPTIKNEELKSQGICEEISGHLAENENYPAEQIYIGQEDDCYDPAYFYTLTRNEYIYNIVPISSGGAGVVRSENEITDNFPEFIPASSTFGLINIVRPKPTPPKPRITAPRPVADVNRDSQGRLVCAKKNDKPGKSDKNKKKHLDMECCLDPDEYPNPHCYYPPSKYGKYL